MNLEVYEMVAPLKRDLEIIVNDRSVGTRTQQAFELMRLHEEAGFGKVKQGCTACFYKAMDNLYKDVKNFEALLECKPAPKKKKS